MQERRWPLAKVAEGGAAAEHIDERHMRSVRSCGLRHPDSLGERTRPASDPALVGGLANP